MSLQSTPKQSPISNSSRTPKKMASSQSLNHLLNFTLPPRQHVQSIPRRNNRRNTSHQVWNKERFVNAQYRFAMNPTGDYTVHFADPDIFFQWHDILQIIIPRTSAIASAAARGDSMSQDEGFTTCPICLAPPTAPRMTKCGHVFCFPCILHLLSTSDNLKWVRCPVCFDSVNEKHLKAVKWLDESINVDNDHDEHGFKASSSTSSLDHNTPSPGATLRMRLMQRPQITTLALPRSATWPSDLIPSHEAPFHFLPDVFTFAKFMLATPEYLVENLTRDLDEVAAERRMLASLGDNLALVFVDSAEGKLRHQIAKAVALDTEHLKDTIERVALMQQKIEQQALRNAALQRQAEMCSNDADLGDVPDAFLAQQDAPSRVTTPRHSEPHVSSHLQTTSQPPNRNPRQRRNVNPPPPSTQTYYYYQAASGLPIFLHPLDIKILISHFNSYASFPDIITVRVEASSEGTVNDDLRKRWKYLGHFPEGTDVVFIEADLEGVVGTEGVKNFESALRMRRARRKEKGKRDDKARFRAEEREKEKLVASFGGSAFSPLYNLPPSPAQVEVEEFPDTVPATNSGGVVSATPNSTPVIAGAWGNRSFASALHSSPTAPGQERTGRPPAQGSRVDERDEYDLDIAWHELEQRNSRGTKKRNNRLVILGGAGGRRR